MNSLEAIQREELRELLAALQASERDVCEAQSRTSTRRIERLEDLSPEELAEWLRLMRYAVRRIEVLPHGHQEAMA